MIESNGKKEHRKVGDSRRTFVLGVSVAFLTVIIAIGGWAWHLFIDHSLMVILNWRTSNVLPSTGCIDRFAGNRDRFAWPIRFKRDWTKLYIHGSTLTIRDAQDLARATHIKELKLSCSIEPGAFVPLAQMPRLSCLTIDSRRCRPSDLSDLQASKSLEDLHIHGDELSKELLDAVAEIKSLQRVVLSENVTAEQIEPLARLPNLCSLHVGYLWESPGLIPIFERMLSLQELKMSEDGEIPQSAFKLHAAFPDLRITPSPNFIDNPPATP